MTVRTKDIKRDNSPSPNSYPEQDKQWRGLSHKPSVPKFTIRKGQQSRFLDGVVKQKKGIPGVGAHKNILVDSYDKLAHGPTFRYKKGR